MPSEQNPIDDPHGSTRTWITTWASSTRSSRMTTKPRPAPRGDMTPGSTAKRPLGVCSDSHALGCATHFATRVVNRSGNSYQPYL